MHFADYLTPLSKSDFSTNKYFKGQLGNSVVIYSGKEKATDFKVVIIGLNENRNEVHPESEFNPNKVREFLYKLTDFKSLPVLDLGNLIKGKKLADTYSCIQQIVEYLNEINIVTIFIGGSQEKAIPISKGVKIRTQKPEISFVDACIDQAPNSVDFNSTSYLKTKELSSENLIKSLIGFQSYFVPGIVSDDLKQLGYNLFRLGVIRNNLNIVEPILRDTDFLSFDCSAIRQADSPQSLFKSPNGLYAEEACQLINIGGLSDKIKFLHILGINTEIDYPNQSTHLLAQLVWHFLLGLANRKGDYPVNSIKNYKKIYLKNEKLNHDLVFYKNDENKRFWVEIPSEKEKQPEIFSCSEADYVAACNSEIPERIWKRISNSMKI